MSNAISKEYRVAILWIHRGMSLPPKIDKVARLEANRSISE
jgi:hypothetical protein